MVKVIQVGGNPARAVPGLERLGQDHRFARRRDVEAAFLDMLILRLRNAGWRHAEISRIETALRDHHALDASVPGLYSLHRDLTGLRRIHAGASW
jgi:hypothetical protein